MGELMTYPMHLVRAKGMRPNAPDKDKIQRYFFQEEYAHLQKLQQLPKYALLKGTILYPGCGVDILTPLLYLQDLFAGLEQVTMLLVDKDDYLQTIKAILDDVGISFAEKGNSISFWWKQLQVKAEWITGDIFELLPEIDYFDIYFEKAFRIMKERDSDYERKIVAKLAPGGIIISDSGFRAFPLTRLAVPLELSAYGEMMVGRKEKYSKRHNL